MKILLYLSTKKNPLKFPLNYLGETVFIDLPPYRAGGFASPCFFLTPYLQILKRASETIFSYYLIQTYTLLLQIVYGPISDLESLFNL